MDYEFLSKTMLFSGDSPEEIKTMLDCLGAAKKRYAKSEVIYHAGETVSSLGIVLSGSVQIENDDLVFLYRIKPGRSNKSYGVNVAKLAKLPDEVLNRANVLLEALEENNIENHLSDDSLKEVPVNSPSVVEKYLDGIDPMTLSPIDALSTLIELKKLNESR